MSSPILTNQIKDKKVQETTTMIKDSRERVRKIKRCILQEEAKLREKYSLLKHQNSLGLLFFIGTIIAIFVIGWSYLTGRLKWYFVIPLMGLPISILHELEHDLIHNLYFKNSKLIQDIMFSFIWFFKFHGNPWWRRDIHHWHHRVSGQSNDIEERLIGLGMNVTWKRLGVTSHPLGFITEIKDIKRCAENALDLSYMNRASMATALILLIFLKAFPILLLLHFIVPQYITQAYGIDTIYSYVRDFMILLAFPLILRQSCLVAMSTACHYFGDIPKNNLYFQNQILDHWILTPLQIYCWWFGATHIIHHYIPQQPFYMRPLLKKNVFKVMEELGVRKNDWGIIKRANRWNRIVSVKEKEEDKYFAMIWFLSVILCSFVACFLWDFITGHIGFKVVCLFFMHPFYSRNEEYQKQNKVKVAKLKGIPHITNKTIS